MKKVRMVLLVLAALCLVWSLGFACGDAAKGKELFKDPKLSDGTSGKSCASCHPDGKGLERVTEKKEYKVMGKTYKSLEDVTNYFIETAQKGKALDPQSEQMKDLIAYMKSLGTTKAPAADAPKEQK